VDHSLSRKRGGGERERDRRSSDMQEREERKRASTLKTAIFIKNVILICVLFRKVTELWMLEVCKEEVKSKVKVSRYTPWRHIGGEEV
jgi:hypothetical protein